MLHSIRTLLLVCAAALVVESCADTYAAEGAKSGAVGGAVAGAVLGIFTGNVGASMVAGATASAAAGAAIGGMTKKTPQGAAPAAAQTTAAPPDPKVAEQDHALESKLGPANFDAARMLALCRHDSAIELARKAYTTADTPERRSYALMIEAVSDEERGDTSAAAAVYPRLVEIVPEMGSPDKARNAALSGVLKIQQVRKDHGRPATCT